MSRLFFALWPEPAVRDELYRVAQAMQRTCGGRVMRRENLHQTLIFVGGVEGERVADLEAVAAQAHTAPFKLEFGITGYWRHNRIVWAAPGTTPQPLVSLVEALEQGLTQSGVAYDKRPYAAHITLVREARAPALLPTLQFDWVVRDFVLVDSVRGARGVEYRVIARWPLTG